MMMANRATCIVFSDNNFPLEGLDHIRPLCITVGYSAHRVSSIMLDNGSALNICHLAIVIALGFASSNVVPSTKTIRAYDNTKREVMGTLVIDLLISLATLVLRIPTSFNLLLGQPWIHRARAIPSSFIRR